MGPKKRGAEAPLKFTLVPAGAIQKGSQPAAAARMTQFAQGLRFDLADTFAGDREVLADFFKSVLGAVFETESHLDHAFFARGERIQNLLGHFLEVYVDHGVGR